MQTLRTPKDPANSYIILMLNLVGEFSSREEDLGELSDFLKKKYWNKLKNKKISNYPSVVESRRILDEVEGEVYGVLNESDTKNIEAEQLSLITKNR